jgi:DNA polymerase III subunit alpha
VVNPICKLLSDNPLAGWKDALNNKEYLNAIRQYPREWKCIQRLQGNVTNTSMHAGGVIIWDKVSDVLPVKCIPNKSGKRIKRVACFDMDDLHELGHYKFDILGLNTLELQDMCLKNIKEIHGVDIDFDKIDYEDENVIKMIASGDLTGVFQLEEQAARVIEQNPNNFRDIIAINALIRPGTGNNYFARRKGEQEYFLYPNQESYMSETYGDYVYQEQYLMDCHIFAGWSIAFADKHVRKNRDIFSDVNLRTKFIEDALKVGILNQLQAEDMWHNICEAVNGGYAFNKSHSTTYARIAYQNAYMKYYYPICFYAALLTKYGDDTNKVGEIIAECKFKSITILPPSINDSTSNFVPKVDGIVYRLTTIKGLGDSALKEIIRLRSKTRIEGMECLFNSRVRGQLRNNNIENLIKAGCFDFENADREEVMYQFDLLSRTPKQIKDKYQPPRRTYSKSRWEYESMGLFLSEHILDRYAFRRLSSFGDGTPCLVAGICQPNARIFNDKNGKEMAFITISNQFELIKLICFSSTWNEEMKANCEEGNIIYVKGKRQNREVLVNELHLIDKL